MEKNYRMKIFTWLAVLLLFLLINFIFALTTKINFIDIGLPNPIESAIVVVFSLALICFVVWEMWNL
jgi:hypothetical protein